VTVAVVGHFGSTTHVSDVLVGYDLVLLLLNLLNLLLSRRRRRQGIVLLRLLCGQLTNEVCVS